MRWMRWGGVVVLLMNAKDTQREDGEEG